MNKRVYYFLFVSALIVYVFGLFTDIMEIDAAQYASLSHEMLVTRDYFMLHFRELNYLDKPPLCFWLEALSYKVFGLSNFSYKLPSLLFTLLGVFSTFRLAKKLYSEEIAWLASLILFTCQGFFLFNQDVRTDAILTSAIIFAIWQLWEYIDSGKILNFILGFTGIAAAVLAKGPIGLMVPVIAIASQLIYTKRWKELFRIEWLAGLFYVCLLLLPFSLGLYKQYGWYGIRFYYWIQSFGRITGENEWHDNSDYLFFVHTFIWAFLPWAFLTFFSLGYFLFNLLKKSGKDKLSEILSFSGTVLPFIVLSTSKYKLPHYIFVLFPLTSIMSAASIFPLILNYPGWNKILKWLQIITVLSLWILLYSVMIFVFPGAGILIWIIITGLNLVSFYYLIFRSSNWNVLIISPAITIVAVNFMLNTHFYPTLLKYQAAKSIAAEKTELNRNIYAFQINAFAYDFYSGRIVKSSDEKIILNLIHEKLSTYIITDSEGLEFLKNKNAQISELKKYNDYPVTRLTAQFLNPATRENCLRQYYFLKLN